MPRKKIEKILNATQLVSELADDLVGLGVKRGKVTKITSTASRLAQLLKSLTEQLPSDKTPRT